MKMWSANDSKAYWKENLGGGMFRINDNRKELSVDEVFEKIKNGGYKSYYGGDECWNGYVSPYSKKYGQAFHFGGKILLNGTHREFRELEEKIINIMDKEEIEKHDGIVVLTTFERMPSVVFEDKKSAMDFAYKNNFEVCKIIYEYDDGTNYIKSRNRGYGLCEFKSKCAFGNAYKMIYDDVR